MVMSPTPGHQAPAPSQAHAPVPAPAPLPGLFSALTPQPSHTAAPPTNNISSGVLGFAGFPGPAPESHFIVPVHSPRPGHLFSTRPSAPSQQPSTLTTPLPAPSPSIRPTLLSTIGPSGPPPQHSLAAPSPSFLPASLPSAPSQHTYFAAPSTSPGLNPFPAIKPPAPAQQLLLISAAPQSILKLPPTPAQGAMTPPSLTISAPSPASGVTPAQGPARIPPPGTFTAPVGAPVPSESPVVTLAAQLPAPAPEPATSFLPPSPSIAFLPGLSHQALVPGHLQPLPPTPALAFVRAAAPTTTSSAPAVAQRSLPSIVPALAPGYLASATVETQVPITGPAVAARAPSHLPEAPLPQAGPAFFPQPAFQQDRHKPSLAPSPNLVHLPAVPPQYAIAFGPKPASFVPATPPAVFFPACGFPGACLCAHICSSLLASLHCHGSNGPRPSPDIPGCINSIPCSAGDPGHLSVGYYLLQQCLLARPKCPQDPLTPPWFFSATGQKQASTFDGLDRHRGVLKWGLGRQTL